jgi:hypothetical protein
MSSRVNFNAMRLFALVICLVVFCAGSTLAALPPLRLEKTAPNSNSGTGRYAGANIGMGGKIYEGYISTCPWGSSFATWVVPNGYTAFEGYCGIDDTNSSTKAEFTFSIDGDEVKTLSATKGSKAIKVSIPVRAGQSFRITMDTCGAAVAEPQFVAGATTTSTSSSSSYGTPIQLTPVSGSVPVGVLSTSVPGDHLQSLFL